MSEMKNYTLNFSFGTTTAVQLSFNFAGAKLACTRNSAQIAHGDGVGV